MGAWNGELTSAYYHPTKSHTATTIGKLGEKQSRQDQDNGPLVSKQRDYMGIKPTTTL